MALFKPKFITFDCYGTLINFDMAGARRAASKNAWRLVRCRRSPPISPATAWTKYWARGGSTTTW